MSSFFGDISEAYRMSYGRPPTEQRAAQNDALSDLLEAAHDVLEHLPKSQRRQWQYVLLADALARAEGRKP